MGVQYMRNIDDVRSQMPCPLHTIFCIINQFHTDCVEPWYGQIKQLADGALRKASGMHKAVIFGMYPELEEASKEWLRAFKDIYNEFENNPHQDIEISSDSLKKLSFQIGEQYGLNENKYLFNKMTEEQAKRVQGRKDIEIRKMCNESAEAMFDPLHIVMQGVSKKLTYEDCLSIANDFCEAQDIFYYEKCSDLESIKWAKKEAPEAYSIYKQMKECLETAEIKDCYQTIDDTNYSRFAQTLGNFKYKGKEYNLLDVVRPITQKRDAFGRIKEVRVNTFSLSHSNKRV